MRDYRDYAEQLRAPASWWVLGEISALILASTAWAGLPVLAAVGSYVLFCGGCAVVLLTCGGARITVTDGKLHAGPATLWAGDIGQVAAVSENQARQLRGPRADPAAFLLIRPYVKGAVCIEVAGDSPAWPYWLISTRRPGELVAAIERAREAARAGDASVG